MIGVLSSMSSFFRLSMYSSINLRSISTCTHPLYFRVTDTCLGEPLKKKKKLDPAIIRNREERRKKRLSKQIRVLEKYTKLMKPIYEIETGLSLREEEKHRSRCLAPLPSEEVERRALLRKEWCRYKRDQWLKDMRVMESIALSQENALKELKSASKELYNRAIEIDNSFLPYSAVGPFHTPPINNYDSPDGVYTDVTVKYEGETS